MEAGRIIKRIQFSVGIILTTLLIWYMSALYISENKSLNSHYLLNPLDSLKVLKLDFSQNKVLLETQIRNNIASSDMTNPVQFGLEINGKIYNSSIHAPHINQFVCFGIPAMRHKSPQLDVMMNEKHMLMVDGIHQIRIDSLAEFIEWYYPNDAPFGEKIVKLKCSEKCGKSEIHDCIQAIGEGYLNYYEKTAIIKFKKSVEDLDSIQLEFVRSKYPFELRLWLGDPAPVFIPPIMKPTSFSGINL